MDNEFKDFTTTPTLTFDVAPETKEAPAPKTVLKDRFTVAEKVVSIRNYSREHKRFDFEDLFSNDMTKSEMINVFLALLELLKLQNIKVEQNGLFNKIHIISNEEGA